MTGQQRNILATMGVDVWIPRTLSCQKKQATSLWRDQTPSENHVELNVVHQEKLETVRARPELTKNIEPTSPQKNTPQTPELVEVAAFALDTPANALPQDQMHTVVLQQAFTLEAYCLDQVILVVESSQLSKEQRQLWTNIQSSVSGFYHELKWPLPLENFRDGRGVQAYIQGFLDALALDKRILILGQFEFMTHSQSMQLASLQQMIDQPLLKRRLWQLMLTP